jgi:hypothetical protein
MSKYNHFKDVATAFHKAWLNQCSKDYSFDEWAETAGKDLVTRVTEEPELTGKYGDNVKLIAEEMARDELNGGKVPDIAFQAKVDQYERAARIAIKHVANTAQDAFVAGADLYAGYCEDGEDEDYLLSNGLIPDKEDGQNEEA